MACATATTRSTVLLVAAAIAGLMLLGYAELFTGASFLVDEDCVSLFDYASRNALTTGWRADMGLGISGFMADPGANSAWALFGLIEKALGRAAFVYPASVLVLLFLTALSVHWLLRRALPAAEQGWWMVPLALMIVFSPLQHEFYFQRHWITQSLGAVLLGLLLVDYLDRPRPRQILLFALALAAIFAFGSLAGVMHLGVGTVVLLGAYMSWHRQPAWVPARRFVVLWAGGGVLMALLMAWVAYPLLLEQAVVGYTRDPVRDWPLFSTNSLPWLVVYLSKFLHVGWLPEAAHVRGLEKFDAVSWENVTPIFPLVLAVMVFRRSAGFWEYAAKVVVVALWGWHLGYFFAPGLTVGMLQKVINGYPVTKFHTFFQVFELLLIAFFLLRLKNGELIAGSALANGLRRALALVLTGFYGGLALFALALLAAPGPVGQLAAKVATVVVPPERLELAHAMLAGQLEALHTAWSPLFVLFYGVSAVSVALFLAPRRLEALVRRSPAGVAFALLATNLLMSWTLYPLARQPLIWDEALATHPEVKAALKPTDRFYVSRPPEPKPTTAAAWRAWNLGHAERVGYRLSPGLDLSYRKNMTQREAFDFQVALVNATTSGDTINSVRMLANRPPLPPNALLDIAAVNYVYSDRPLPLNDSLAPVMAHPDLYLYRYKRAWPYAYLAAGVAPIARPEDMASKGFGPAYLLPGDRAALPEGVGADREARLTVTAFGLGGYAFDYASRSPALLVVADAWHPFWRAELDGRPVPLVKANGVFKAAVLPTGAGRVTFSFDTAPYRPGIYVSLATLLLVLGLLWRSRRA